MPLAALAAVAASYQEFLDEHSMHGQFDKYSTNASTAFSSMSHCERKVDHAAMLETIA